MSAKSNTRHFLIDEPLDFHFAWKEGKTWLEAQERWRAATQGRTREVWQARAFHGLCVRHIDELATAVGAAGAAVSTFFDAAAGVQVDLVFDRPDGGITLCEVEYCQAPLTVTKGLVDNMRLKKERFWKTTRTRKLITTAIIAPRIQKTDELDAFDHVVALEHLMGDTLK
jgi:hypothetical protein